MTESCTQATTRALVQPPAFGSYAQVTDSVVSRVRQRLARPPGSASDFALRSPAALAAQKREAEDLRAHLFAVAEPSIAQVAAQAWEYLRCHLLQCGLVLAVPDSADMDAGVMLIWDDRRVHVELEVDAAGAIECFAKDRESGALWHDEPELDGLLECGIVAWLTHFAQG